MQKKIWRRPLNSIGDGWNHHGHVWELLTSSVEASKYLSSTTKHGEFICIFKRFIKSRKCKELVEKMLMLFFNLHLFSSIYVAGGFWRFIFINLFIISSSTSSSLSWTKVKWYREGMVQKRAAAFYSKLISYCSPVSMIFK